MQFITNKDIVGTYSLEQRRLEADPIITSLAEVVTSDQAAENHVVVSSNPKMTEKENGQLAHEFREWNQTVKNVEYSAEIKIKKNDLRRNRFQVLQGKIASLAQVGLDHNSELLYQALQNGSTTVSWTGSFFFDTTHQFGNSPVQSNLLSLSLLGAGFPTIPSADRGTANDPSPRVALDTVYQAIANILGMKTDAQTPMNSTLRNFKVAVPIHYLKSFSSAINSDLLSGGESNSLKASSFSVDLVASPYLTGNSLYVWGDSVVKPFYIQQESLDQMSILGEGSDHFFKNNSILVKLENSKSVAMINFGAISKVNLVA